jgi:zinc-binding alcohol dehydrogenase family protein
MLLRNIDKAKQKYIYIHRRGESVQNNINSEMKAVGLKKYGDIEVLEDLDVPRPGAPQGRELLVRIKASSVNPIDTKVREGVYDDYPDYYDHVPFNTDKYQILGFDSSGVVEEVGSDASRFKIGDEIYFVASPFRHGSNAELVLADERGVALKPRSLSFEQAAGIPLTAMTAWEALVERLEIKEGEQVAILIINGAGGVGSIATQICAEILRLPVIITTASRDETRQFSKEMGATHVINHHDDIAKQINQLNLTIPLKYAFITHTTMEEYVKICADVLSPFGKMCSVVQGKFDFYGTSSMGKCLTFVWELLSTKIRYGGNLEAFGELLEKLAKLIDQGKIKSHVTQTFEFNCENLRKVHDIIDKGKAIGKITLKMNT